MAHIDCSFYSTSLKKNAHVIVFLPSVSADDYLEGRNTDYYEEDKAFPTLYLLHGSYGDCTDWSLRTSVERYAQEKGLAVVMPSGENSCYTAMAMGEDYLTYIGQELPAFTRKLFPLSRSRAQTYIAGLSMGGYGAYRVGLAFPETFGSIASLSGALDMQALQAGTESHTQKMDPHYKKAIFEDSSRINGTQNDLVYLLRGQIDGGGPLPALYMNCGTEDFILAANESFYAAATALGAKIRYEKFPGAHDWTFWDAHIQNVLQWLN